VQDKRKTKTIHDMSKYKLNHDAETITGCLSILKKREQVLINAAKVSSESLYFTDKLIDSDGKYIELCLNMALPQSVEEAFFLGWASMGLKRKFDGLAANLKK